MSPPCSSVQECGTGQGEGFATHANWCSFTGFHRTGCMKSDYPCSFTFLMNQLLLTNGAYLCFCEDNTQPFRKVCTDNRQLTLAG